MSGLDRHFDSGRAVHRYITFVTNCDADTPPNIRHAWVFAFPQRNVWGRAVSAAWELETSTLDRPRGSSWGVYLLVRNALF